MNRSLILLAAMLLTCNLVKAQTEKGDQNLGADFSVATDHSNTSSPSITSSRYTDFDIGPSYSYFVATNWAVSANVDYSSTITDYSINPNIYEPSQTKSNGYSAMVSLRRYFMFQNKIGICAGVYTGFGHSNNSVIYPPGGQDNNTTNNINYAEAGVSLSLVYYPCKKLGVSLLLGNLEYQHYTESSSQLGKSSDNDFSLGFKTDELGLSLFYVFGGKG